jgi:hypothetical protein
MLAASSVGARMQKAIRLKAGADRSDASTDIERPAAKSIGAMRAKRAMILCSGAIVFTLAAYIIAAYGFDSVVKCELEQFHLSRQAQTVMTEIALTGGCGP